ncbi:hypothetical protein C4U10_05560, partial [Clostridioides difficile]|nr:hypothetical protein [Clostridioides difficile]MDB3131662.1 hypothetical protein [Clostridioides difficile]
KISFTALFIVSSNSFLTVSSTKPLSSISTSASFIILFKSILLSHPLFSFLRVTKHFKNIHTKRHFATFSPFFLLFHIQHLQ